MISKSLILKPAPLALGVILLAVPVPTPAAEESAQQKIYPPYPDVWGREMPNPKEVRGLVTTGSTLAVFEGSSGQILINVGYLKRPSGGPGTTFLYDFFSGRVVKEWRWKDIPGSETDIISAFAKANGYRELRNLATPGYAKNIPLPDGGHFKETSDLSDVFDNGLQRFDAAGRLMFHRMIVHLSDRAFYVRGTRPSEFFGGRKYIHFRAMDILPRVFPLRDGTFLLTGGWRPVVIRFKGNLDSPYINRSGKIVPIEPEKAHKMFVESWFLAGPIIRRLRKQIPDIPWILPEITDELMVSKFKKPCLSA